MHIQVRDDTSCQVLRSHSRSCLKYCSSPWKLPYLCSPRNHHPSNYTWLVGSTVIKSSIYFCRSSLRDDPRSQQSQKTKSNVVGCHIYLKKIPYVMLKVTWPHILSNILKHLRAGKPHFKSTGTKLQATWSLKWRGNNTHGWNQGRPSQSSSKTTTHPRHGWTLSSWCLTLRKLQHSHYIFPDYVISAILDSISYKPGHATTTFFWEQKKDANQICPTLKPSGRYTTARSKPFAKTSGARKPSGCFAMSRANLASHSWRAFWLR